MDHFELVSEFKPTGDQPQAIEELVEGFKKGNQCETLLGVTGSGKTFTMANVIQQLNKPTLIIAHNKTLAAQLYGEFKEFFPNNAVEYFVSYYDYYQPEAYVPSTDTYIEKDSAINDEIDKLRHSATMALMERKDVIIISSVSCIYGLGDPIDYKNMVVSLRPGMIKDRDEVIRKLIEIQYDRNDMDFKRGTFRVRGDVVEVFPASYGDTAVRIEFFGDEVDRITEIDTLTGEVKNRLEHVAIFPNSHYVIPPEKMEGAIAAIEKELAEHNMLVDLGRNDVGKISRPGSVKVDKYMEIQRFSHVMHIGSTVTGTISEEKDALDVVDAILPAGTLSGAPKIRACEIIAELEKEKRGIYGGAVGYLDFAGNVDTCISIRLAYKKNGSVRVQSGAGIVADSIPENEFQECLNKAGAVLQAIKIAEGGLG